MAYRPPTFNLECNVWVGTDTPADNPPTYLAIPCQKYVTSKGQWPIDLFNQRWYIPPIYLRLPIDSGSAWVDGQIFELPAPSGQYYLARWKEVVHQGFPNQYFVVIIEQCDALGQPEYRYTNSW